MYRFAYWSSRQAEVSCKLDIMSGNLIKRRRPLRMMRGRNRWLNAAIAIGWIDMGIVGTVLHLNADVMRCSSLTIQSSGMTRCHLLLQSYLAFLTWYICSTIINLRRLTTHDALQRFLRQTSSLNCQRRSFERPQRLWLETRMNLEITLTSSHIALISHSLYSKSSISFDNSSLKSALD